ncbi:MAG TPA: cytochrome c-type biogenesis CcmF C-terminal domain-containing protein [Polyangia bacterium]|nr:cytochrome c-type biogenesis CcmF C-terminal domain-containing protein [Polyangia bacterium]
MAAFGTLTLLIALVVATYAGVASVVGARRGNRRLIASGRAGVYALAAVLGLSSVALVYAFVSHDYSIKYVHHYSDAASPLFYQITAYWGGLDGSILWWVFLLSVFSTIAIYTNRNRHRELLPYTVAVLMAIADFFLFVIVFYKNPFDTYLTDIPTTGKGLNPLLQNAYMVTHPPSLYTGFVGMSIPFAFGMGALISGQLDDTWIASVRKWTLGAWFFLSMGLTLGMLWAYEELGWGGFWAWDPVENAGFLPWLTATAFVHSIMIQERRGMMKIWNVSLLVVTFFLTIFGTFMTRSGIVQSVHAFGQDTKLAWTFTIFMALTLIVSFGFVIYRMPELRSRARLDSWLSREAAFLANNWILLFAAFFMLFATMFPTLSDALFHERITVSAPFFNLWMVPIGLTLLFLTGVGPLLAWRKATPGNLVYQFTVPLIATLIVVIGCFAFGLHTRTVDADIRLSPPSGSTAMAPLVLAVNYVLRGFAIVSKKYGPIICFGLCAWVLASIAQEYWRGMAIRRRNTGQGVVSATLGMVLRGKRRYGGYLVHLGIMLMFVGFAGSAYQKEKAAKLAPGQSVTFEGYTVRFDKLAHEEDRQKEMVTGELTTFVRGKEIDRPRPAKWFFHNHESEPTTEVAIKRGPIEDLYITMGGYELAEGTATFKLVRNPMVDWVWFGFMLLAVATGIVLVPESVLERLTVGATATADAAGRAAAGAAGIALFVALGAGGVVLLSPRPAAAQMAGGAQDAPEPTGPDEIWLVHNIMCQCTTCRHNLIECQSEGCGHAIQDRIAIRQLLDQGRTREQVVEYFIKKYGGQVALAAPLNSGFNRLAWLFPYSIAAIAAGGLGYGAYRLAKRPPAPSTTTEASITDPELADKLDDELRNLD